MRGEREDLGVKSAVPRRRGPRVTSIQTLISAACLLTSMLFTASASRPVPSCVPVTATLLPASASVAQRADCSLELSDLRCALLALAQPGFPGL